MIDGYKIEKKKESGGDVLLLSKNRGGIRWGSMYLGTYVVMWRVTCVAVEFWAQLSHYCTSFHAVDT